MWQMFFLKFWLNKLYDCVIFILFCHYHIQGKLLYIYINFDMLVIYFMCFLHIFLAQNLRRNTLEDTAPSLPAPLPEPKRPVPQKSCAA